MLLMSKVERRVFDQSNPNPSSPAGPIPIVSNMSSLIGWMYVDTPGTFNSPRIVGFIASDKSIVQSGSMFLKVTR